MDKKEKIEKTDNILICPHCNGAGIVPNLGRNMLCVLCGGEKTVKKRHLTGVYSRLKRYI